MRANLERLAAACEAKGVSAEQLALVMAACLELGWVMEPKREALPCADCGGRGQVWSDSLFRWRPCRCKVAQELASLEPGFYRYEADEQRGYAFSVVELADGLLVLGYQGNGYRIPMGYLEEWAAQEASTSARVYTDHDRREEA